MFPWRSGAGKPPARWPSSRRRAIRSRRWWWKAAPSSRPSGARLGARTWNAIATLPTGLPRGRTYVRNGSVIDLQIAPGEIKALVSGSEIYKVEVKVAPVAKARWQSICKDCAGAIDSLIELLQGRFSKGVMERVCRQKTGLFPSPDEIQLSCSCPDWAEMCKHVAAVLYGIGARLDQQPDLLFRLHNVDEKELIAGAGKALPQAKRAPAASKVLGGEDLSALFGLDMAQGTGADAAVWRHSRGAEACEGASRQDGPRQCPVERARSAHRAVAGKRRKQSTAAPGIPWLEKEMMPSYVPGWTGRMSRDGYPRETSQTLPVASFKNRPSVLRAFKESALSIFRTRA